MLLDVLLLFIGYLFGSIPSGVIVTRFAGADDPRGIGSKNIGATNVLRSGRKDLAAVTLVADALKGTIPVLIAGSFDRGNAPVHLAVMAALGAFLGHLFPLYLGFRGGKGVATFIGCLIALSWQAALGFAVVWLAVAFLTRYSSAGALSASLAAPVLLMLLARKEAAILYVILAVAVWIKHRTNIARILAGTESKIGQKGSPAS